MLDPQLDPLGVGVLGTVQDADRQLQGEVLVQPEPCQLCNVGRQLCQLGETQRQLCILLLLRGAAHCALAARTWAAAFAAPRSVRTPAAGPALVATFLGPLPLLCPCRSNTRLG